MLWGMRGPPPNPYTAEAVALVQAGSTPAEVSSALAAQGKAISTRTIYRALVAASGAEPVGRVATPRPETARPDQRPPELSSVRSTIPTGSIPQRRRAAPPEAVEKREPTGPALPAPKLAELRDLIGRLPFAQQDALVTTLPLERLRRAAIVRGLAPYHQAAVAVARELRAVRP